MNPEVGGHLYTDHTAGQPIGWGRAAQQVEAEIRDAGHQVARTLQDAASLAAKPRRG